MEFKYLTAEEQRTFEDWAEHYFTEHLWPRLAEAQLWHPIIRERLLTRIEEALAVDPSNTRMIKEDPNE